MTRIPSYYGTRFGCRFGQPHDFTQIKDARSYKVERCTLCGKRVKTNKGYKGRVDNVKYLRDHLRNYAQQFGATKRVYNKLYEPQKTIIYI